MRALSFQESPFLLFNPTTATYCDIAWHEHRGVATTRRKPALKSQEDCNLAAPGRPTVFTGPMVSEPEDFQVGVSGSGFIEGWDLSFGDCPPDHLRVQYEFSFSMTASP